MNMNAGIPPQPNTAAPTATATPVQAAPAPAQPQPAGVQEEIRGAQRVSNTEFNQQMQNILLSRIEEEGTKNPNFGGAIDAGVSREAALEIALIIPELLPIFKQMGVLDDVGQQGGIQAPQPPAPPSGPSAGAGINPNANPQNPILRDSAASQGLVG